MNLQIANNQVEFDFPLQPTGSTPVKGELVEPIDEKIQYRIKVSYTITPVDSQQ